MVHFDCPEKSPSWDSHAIQNSNFCGERRQTRAYAEHCKWDSTAAAGVELQAPAAGVPDAQRSDTPHGTCASTGALGLAYVAAGRLDAYFESHINAWDVLAGLVLVVEAGGYASDFLANEGLTKGNSILVCAPGVREVLIQATRMDA